MPINKKEICGWFDPLASDDKKMPVKREEFVGAMAVAMAQFEGFFNKTPSIAKRHNNPGNLRSWGKNPVVKGYAVFPTEVDGWKAMKAQVNKNIDRKLTFYTFFAGVRNETGRLLPGKYSGYAPALDNNHPKIYASFVVNKLNKFFGAEWTTDTLIYKIFEE